MSLGRSTFLRALESLNPDLARSIIDRGPLATPLEALVDLEPTDAVEARLRSAQTKVAELEALGAEQEEVLSGRRIHAARAEVARAERVLTKCQERDAIQATRPTGCFCLGEGGRNPAYLGVVIGGQVYPVQDESGEPVLGFRDFCGCIEGLAARARAKTLRDQTIADRQSRQVTMAWGDVGIPEHFQDATLESWAAEVHVAGGDPSKVLARLEAWLQGSSWLVLRGPYGRGKTGLLVAVVRQFVEQGKSALFRTVPDLLGTLRQTYSGDGREGELLRALYAVDVLALDDLGADRATDWAQETLFKLLNKRHDEHKRTLISTNLDLNGLAKHLHERNWERVREMTGRFGVVLVDGPNLRDARVA